MEDQEQFLVRFKYESFSQPVDSRHEAVLDRGERRIDRSKQKRRRQAYADNARAHDPWAERVEVQKDVWELGHVHCYRPNACCGASSWGHSLGCPRSPYAVVAGTARRYTRARRMFDIHRGCVGISITWEFGTDIALTVRSLEGSAWWM